MAPRTPDPQVPIEVFPAFDEVNEALYRLLEGLSPEEWSRPTVHRDRDVKDLAAHLLHGSLRRLSGQRDAYAPPGPPIDSFEDLVRAIQSDNRAFMDGVRRLSPRVLLEWMRAADAEVTALLRALDPHGEALWPVAWAGEARSPAWFDVAREYTEKWHHQQQLRDATGRPPLPPHTLGLTLDTFARGLPHAFRDTPAPLGAEVEVRTSGEVERAWTLRRGEGAWTLLVGAAPRPVATFTLPADQAWRMWTRGPPTIPGYGLRCSGEDWAFSAALAGFVAIMA